MMKEDDLNPLQTRDSDVAMFDMLEELQGAHKFSNLYSVLVTGLIWCLSGAQISLSLFVTQEPPRFPDCDKLPIGCNPTEPLPPHDCDTPFKYLRPGVSVVSTYNLPSVLCESQPWRNVTWIHSALFLGILTGALFLAPLADKKGRRPIMTLGVLGTVVAAMYSIIAPSIYLYGLARFFVGCFSSASSLPSMAALSEITASDRRQWIVGVQALSFCTAAGTLAICSFLIPSWRLLTIIVTLPAFVFLLGVPCCARVYIESPRWLAAKGRMSEAFDVWLHIASVCHVNLPEQLNLNYFIKSELQNNGHERSIQSKEDLEEELSLRSVRQMVTPDSVPKAFRTFPSSLWIWVCIWVWSVCAFIYYGILLDFGDLISSLKIDGEPPHSTNVGPPHVYNLSDAAPPILYGSTSPATAHIRLLQPVTQTMAGVLDVVAQSIHTEAAVIPSHLISQLTTLQALPPVLSPGIALPTASVTQPASDGSAVGEAKAPYLQYMEGLGEYFRNGSQNLYESAKNLPAEAEKLYDGIRMNAQLDDLYDDLSAQFRVNDPLAPFWKKIRIEGVLVLASFALEIPAYAISMYTAAHPRIGRKRTTIIFLYIGGALILSGYLLRYINLDTRKASIVLLACVVVGRCCVAAVFMLLYLYCAEIFPTGVRNSCLGIFSAAARIGCIVAAPVANALDTRHSGAALLLFGLLALSAATICVDTLPETMHQPLFDTLDTLEDVYSHNHYTQTLSKSATGRICKAIRPLLCCCGRWIGKCLALPGASADERDETSFEGRGHAWLKKQWKNANAGRQPQRNTSRYNQLTNDDDTSIFRARNAGLGSAHDPSGLSPAHNSNLTRLNRPWRDDGVPSRSPAPTSSPV